MNRLENKKGFTIMEALVVTGIIALLVSMSGAIVSKYTVSRSFDDTMKGMSSMLQMAKMKAARHGVEYRAVFALCTNLNTTDEDCTVCDAYQDFASGDDTITMSIERGNSNRGSDRWCIESTITKKISNYMDLDMTDIPESVPYRCGFNPNGFVVDENGSPMTIDPVPDNNNDRFSMSIVPSANAEVNRCGIVDLWVPLGRISVLQGNWDGTTCEPIREPVATPGP